jgi:hypothetical protein
VTDFGRAASSAFQATATEAEFLGRHAEHDLAYVVTELVNWVMTRLTEASRTWARPSQRNDSVPRMRRRRRRVGGACPWRL